FSAAGNLGLGAQPGGNRLTVSDPGTSFAINVSAAKHGLAVVHTNDLAGEAVDLVNLFHKGTGDALFVNHLGGEPPGYTGPSGGDAAFNALIPYYLDHGGSGYDGTSVNDRTGMKGLQVYTQPPNPDING